MNKLPYSQSQLGGTESITAQVKDPQACPAPNEPPVMRELQRLGAITDRIRSLVEQLGRRLEVVSTPAVKQIAPEPSKISPSPDRLSGMLQLCNEALASQVSELESLIHDLEI